MEEEINILVTNQLFSDISKQYWYLKTMILDFKLEIRKITFLLVMRIKKKRVKFCKDNQKTYRKLIIFSDEFWIFASQNRPRYMWEKDGK
jgi:hypothetical protein